jgi:hypothetical protein
MYIVNIVEVAQCNHFEKDKTDNTTTLLKISK